MFVSDGRGQWAATPTTLSATNARDAEARITALRNAISHRRHNPVTPFNWSVWFNLLNVSGLLDKYYPHIPSSIRFGFNIAFPSIHSTNTPHNSATMLANHDEFTRIVRHERESGRYLGPLSQEEVELLIGPFQTSPLSLVPKHSHSTKLRLIQNFSFPRSPSPLHSSINSAIDSDLFPCTWGTFTAFALSIWRLPPGSEGACRDVSEAYRRIPIHFTQWPAAVVRTSESTFDLDFSVSFGAKSGCGAFGSVADAGADILRYRGIGPVGKWVDDHLFIRIRRKYVSAFNKMRAECHGRIMARGGRHHTGGRFWFGGDALPDGRVEEFDEDMAFPVRDLSGESPRSEHDKLFTYNFDDIDAVTKPLGYVWELAKDYPFASEVPFTGLIWHLDNRVVSVGREKKLKYLASIAEWRTSSAHVLLAVQKLYHQLLHVTLVIPMGRAYLTNLEAMLGIFHDSPHKPRTPPADTADDLAWWESVLSRPVLCRAIPGPCEVFDCGAFSDASSGTGIAIIINGRWRAWRLLPGWDRGDRDIGWAEAIGFEFLVYAVISSTSAAETTHFKLFGDNTGVVEGWWNNRSRNRETNAVFRRIHDFLERTNYSVHSR